MADDIEKDLEERPYDMSWGEPPEEYILFSAVKRLLRTGYHLRAAEVGLSAFYSMSMRLAGRPSIARMSFGRIELAGTAGPDEPIVVTVGRGSTAIKWYSSDWQ